MLNYMPFVLRAFIFHVPTCLRAYLPVYIFRGYMPSCLCALIFHVPKCLKPLSKFIEAHFVTSYCCFSLDCLTFIPFKTPKQTPASKTVYLNPTLWRFLSQLVHAQSKYFEDPLRNYLIQWWTLSSILNPLDLY